MNPPIVKIRNLELAYRAERTLTKVVGPVSFDIAEGETLGLIGESGAGKSTLALEMLGLLKYKGGRRTGGEIVYTIQRQEIAYIPQDPLSSLDPMFSIGSQLTEVREAKKNVMASPERVWSSPLLDCPSTLLRVLSLTKDFARLWRSRHDRVHEIERALNRVHLPLDKMSLRSYPHELSGGMRQRVLIAMALLGNPKLIVADEPTSSLDVTLQAEILDLFREIKASGISFLFVTHNIPVARNFCDRILIMKQGMIVEENRSDEIFKCPRDPYTQTLVQSVPRLDLA